MEERSPFEKLLTDDERVEIATALLAMENGVKRFSQGWEALTASLLADLCTPTCRLVKGIGGFLADAGNVMFSYARRKPE